MPDLAEVFGDGDGEPLPQSIGGYPIVRLLGRGATGVVYEARARRPPRPVAIKLLYPGATSASLRTRFAVEAELLARLDHPGIARLYEAGSEEIPGPHGAAFRLSFLVMEHVAGERLDHWADDPERPLAEVLETFVALCDAVAHAHRRGVLHRDLKPANVLVTAGGQPKVLDFGIACASQAAGEDQARITATGQVLGSVAYMSPEQLQDCRRATERSDVYSLGVILYRMLSGRLPFEAAGRSLVEQAAAVIEGGAPPPLSLHDRALGGDLETVVATAMAKRPSERYASADDLALDVRRYLA
ncbi:MAG: serine/threonine protein kinase [Acidobacteria bacterium]|nr:MAG: serine/threonine protein kinase [Acidobacteriota bacterium]